MSIRDEALAAYETARQSQVEAAKQHLLDTVLHDPTKSAPAVDPKTVVVVGEDHDADMFVFTGAEGDVHLAVHRGEEVTLVEDRDGWTRVAGPLKTLADLGEVLA